MKAIKAEAGAAVLVDVPRPGGDGVLVQVASASICGSDLHMLELGYFGDRVIGHEFAGYAPDGRAVAVEPTLGCGSCGYCAQGDRQHCCDGAQILGVSRDGGMAEYVLAPAHNLVQLPTGLDISSAALVEPLAVAVHTVQRLRLRGKERLLVIGAGPIGLAVAAVLQSRGFHYDVSARHEHQRQVAASLGAGIEPGTGYDVVIDAVGSSRSLQQSIAAVKPLGRIGMAGSFWNPVDMDVSFCVKELELVAASTYHCKAPQRDFEEAGRLLHAKPQLADLLVTHRFPLEAVGEAFNAAANRAGGAIKVLFEISRQAAG